MLRPRHLARWTAASAILFALPAIASAQLLQDFDGSVDGSGSRYEERSGVPSTYGQPELQTPASEPASEEIAPPGGDSPTATSVTAAQPVGSYDGQTHTWLPNCNLQSSGWMQELEVPAGLIDCTCNGKAPGPRYRVWRSFVKPTDPSIDPRCVVCVKEPCLDYETVEEEYRVVIHRCFESTEPFKHTGCEGGHCYEAKGTTKLRKLHPCEAKVPVKYQKPVVRYRDVYYYIQCDCDEA
ncbi:MAG: hypothetical protein AAGF31_07020 [Planctomycetota bacterium]